MPITIYADSNIYRYVATGELEIITIGSIRFAYSNVHFEEIIRTGNTEMLKGMEELKAVPVVSNENGEYDVDDIGVCLEYVNPFENFEYYKEHRIPAEDAESSINEMLLRLLGADNFEELQNVPQSLLDMAKEVMEYGGSEAEAIANKISNTVRDLDDFIEQDLSKRRPLTDTRKELGYPKGATSLHDNDQNPINAIWARLKSKIPGVTKDQFFGFAPIPGIDSERSRLGDIASCHIILNMVGFHPDSGPPKREKIRNIISDGQHLGFGSICGGFLTSDRRLYRKAQAIFEYKEYLSKAMHVVYEAEGMSVILIEPGFVNSVKLDRDNGT